MPSQNTQHHAAQELELTADERVVVAAMRVTLLRRDRSATTDTTKRATRAGQLDSAVHQVIEGLGQADDPNVAGELEIELGRTDPEMRASAIEDAVTELGSLMVSRSRALLVLIDVCLFTPDRAGWDARTRRRTLVELTACMPVLDAADLDRVQAELTTARRVLARRQTHWGRLAVAAAAGVGLGVVTMGAATPAIAAAVAGAGLSGAAATSAGLATLGGGSLAAGGFGVAGGSMLLTGVGVVSGLGAGAAGSWATGWSSGQIAAEALRLAVATRLVVLEEQRDEEMAKRVVLALQERLDDVTRKLELLSRRLRELNEVSQRLTAENRRLRAELRAERGATEQVCATLETALERIPVIA